MNVTFNFKGLNLLLLLTLLAGQVTAAKTTSACDQIIGTWMSEQKNCIVQIFKDGESFRASVVWFDDSDDKTQPMYTRMDDKNPDKNLRTRKILGMNVLRNLTYNANSNSWENGFIYDAKSGREWSSAAMIDNEGCLKVTGYWHFKFIGKSIKFKRVSSNERLLTSR